MAVSLLLLALCTAPVSAQSTLFLEPEAYTAGSGSELRIGCLGNSAERWEAQPWPAEQMSWAFLRLGGGQHNWDQLPRLESDPRSTKLWLDKSGTALIGLDLKPRIQTIPSKRLLTLLQRYGSVDDVLTQRVLARKQIRLKTLSSAKTLVRVAGVDGKVTPSSVAQSKSGQQVEIRPLADPTNLQPGSDFPFKLYYPQKNLFGQQIRFGRAQQGMQELEEAVRDGITFLQLTERGAWKLEASALAELRPVVDGDADWALFSATLTFEVVR